MESKSFQNQSEWLYQLNDGRFDIVSLLDPALEPKERIADLKERHPEVIIEKPQPFPTRIEMMEMKQSYYEPSPETMKLITEAVELVDNYVQHLRNLQEKIYDIDKRLVQEGFDPRRRRAIFDKYFKPIFSKAHYLRSLPDELVRAYKPKSQNDTLAQDPPHQQKLSDIRRLTFTPDRDIKAGTIVGITVNYDTEEVVGLDFD